MGNLYFIICGVISLIYLFGAIKLHKRKEENVHHLVLVWLFVILAVISAGRILNWCIGLPPSAPSASGLILLYLFIVTTYSVYPYRRLFPSTFREWRLIMLYFPFFFILLIMYLAERADVEYVDFQPYEALVSGEFWRFNILVRFYMYLNVLLCSLWLPIICFRHLKDGFVRRYSLVTGPFIALIMTAILFAPQHYFICLYIYIIGSLAISIYLVYAALNCDVLEGFPPEELLPSGGDGDEFATPFDQADSDVRVWRDLESCMTVNEPWRDPNLKLNELARMVYSNRTTVSTVIHTQGYDSFHDYIAKYRIDAFCDYVRDNGLENYSISQLFTMVGFQSSSSAFKHFKRIYNMTPSQYIKNI